ncbi:MAG: YeeE/YedE family protein [Bacteroidetes bacterium]|nr:YeeE/YedE family protein [Bacteroidota bacterium]
MLELLRQPWHWSIAGIVIGLIVPALLILGNKKFGISSSMKHACAACLPGKFAFFDYDWKKEIWNLYFVVGILIGAVIAATYLADPNDIVIAERTKLALINLGVTDFTTLLPADIFSWDSLKTSKGWIFIAVGGFFVGFGTRWADGCTSGHSIMGIANLQWPSLLATVFFFAGGLVMTHLLLPLIL